MEKANPEADKPQSRPLLGKGDVSATLEERTDRPSEPGSAADAAHPSAEVIESRYGITQRNQSMLQIMADRYGLAIDVRPSNRDSLGLLELGAPQKPEAIKSKTINDLDVLLAPDARTAANLAAMKGAVGFFEPTLPAKPRDLDSEQWSRLQARCEQRQQEYTKLKGTFADLEERGQFKVVDGVVYPFNPLPIREAAGQWGTPQPIQKTERPDREAELPYRVLYVASTGEPLPEGVHGLPATGLIGELDQKNALKPPIDRLPHLDPALGPPIAGDHDVYEIRDLDGNHLTSDIVVARVDDLDLTLGADPRLEGGHQYFEPTLPERTDQTDEQWTALQDRFNQRAGEFTELNGREVWYTKLINEAARAADPDQRKAVIGQMPTQAEEFLWRRFGVMHSAHVDWNPSNPYDRTNVYERIIESHKPGGVPLIRFQAGEPPTLVDNETPVRRPEPPAGPHADSR